MILFYLLQSYVHQVPVTAESMRLAMEGSIEVAATVYGQEYEEKGRIADIDAYQILRSRKEREEFERAIEMSRKTTPHISNEVSRSSSTHSSSDFVPSGEVKGGALFGKAGADVIVSMGRNEITQIPYPVGEVANESQADTRGVMENATSLLESLVTEELSQTPSSLTTVALVSDDEGALREERVRKTDESCIHPQNKANQTLMRGAFEKMKAFLKVRKKLKEEYEKVVKLSRQNEIKLMRRFFSSWLEKRAAAQEASADCLANVPLADGNAVTHIEVVQALQERSRSDLSLDEDGSKDDVPSLEVLPSAAGGDDIRAMTVTSPRKEQSFQRAREGGISTPRSGMTPPPERRPLDDDVRLLSPRVSVAQGQKLVTQEVFGGNSALYGQLLEEEDRGRESVSVSWMNELCDSMEVLLEERERLLEGRKAVERMKELELAGLTEHLKKIEAASSV